MATDTPGSAGVPGAAELEKWRGLALQRAASLEQDAAPYRPDNATANAIRATAASWRSLASLLEQMGHGMCPFCGLHAHPSWSLPATEQMEGLAGREVVGWSWLTRWRNDEEPTWDLTFQHYKREVLEAQVADAEREWPDADTYEHVIVPIYAPAPLEVDEERSKT